MPIAYDSGVSTNMSSSATWTQASTVGGGSDRFQIVFLMIASASDLATGVTFNGVAMTQVKNYVMVNFTGRIYAYVLKAPATGTFNVVASFSSAVSGTIHVDNFTGVLQSNVVDASATNSGTGTTHSTSVTTIADNCWLVSHTKDNQGNSTAGANTTLRSSAGAGNGDQNWSTTTDQTPPGSKTLNYANGVSANWDSVAVSIAPALAISKSETASFTDVKQMAIRKTLSEAVSFSDIATLTRIINISVLETVSFADILPAGLAVWHFRTKPSSTWANRTKPSSSWTNRTKPPTTWG